jgi:hypothetical protein
MFGGGFRPPGKATSDDGRRWPTPPLCPLLPLLHPSSRAIAACHPSQGFAAMGFASCHPCGALQAAATAPSTAVVSAQTPPVRTHMGPPSYTLSASSPLHSPLLSRAPSLSLTSHEEQKEAAPMPRGMLPSSSPSPSPFPYPYPPRDMPFLPLTMRLSLACRRLWCIPVLQPHGRWVRISSVARRVVPAPPCLSAGPVAVSLQ